MNSPHSELCELLIRLDLGGSLALQPLAMSSNPLAAAELDVCVLISLGGTCPRFRETFDLDQANVFALVKGSGLYGSQADAR